MVLELIAHGLGGVAFTSVISFLLLTYVIFDVIVSEEMLLLEKLIWMALSITTGFAGLILYLYIVKYREELISDHTDLRSLQRRLDGGETYELERLSRLKERGDLNEDEYRKKKSEVLEGS